MNLFSKTFFHGTPRTFDDFDLSFVGTNTGVGIMGWGIYLMTNKDATDEFMCDYRGDTHNKPKQSNESQLLTVELDDDVNLIERYDFIDVSNEWENKHNRSSYCREFSDYMVSKGIDGVFEEGELYGTKVCLFNLDKCHIVKRD